MHHRLRLTRQRRWVPDEPIIAKKPIQTVPFSLMDEDGTCLPIKLHRDDDVEDALILAGELQARSTFDVNYSCRQTNSSDKSFAFPYSSVASPA